MGLFSFFGKNKQETASGDGEFYSRAEGESKAARTRGKRKPGTDPIDPALPEKKRARRRLVGAIALVLGVIIGLPMILDSEPKPLAGDVDIQIPSKDKPAQQSAPRQAAPSAAVSLAASAMLDRKEAAGETPKPDAAPADKPAEAVKATEAVKRETPQQPVAPAPDAKTAAKQSAQQAAEAARAKAILEGKSDAGTGRRVADGKPATFMVQVAALTAQANINDLQGKLKDAGIASSTQKITTKSGESTRIRIGPFSKEEAENMRARLIKLGLDSTLVPSP